MNMDGSKFNMWRTITSLAHADGIFCRDEKNYLAPIFESLEMSDSQRQILKSDMKTQQNTKELFNLITEPGDRSQVTYFGRILLWADQDLDHSEEEILAKLTELAMDKVDMVATMAKVKKIAADYKAKEEQRREERPFHRKVIDAIIFWEDLP